jgi:hypothetical protein
MALQPRKGATMEGETTAVRQTEPEPIGLLSTIDGQIMRHQRAISGVTGALAILGVAAIILGFAGLSPNLKALSPF